jgi:hypothetical protein
MTPTSADLTIVKAIRQREFLRHWLQLAKVRNGLPSFADFCPERLWDERQDMMTFDVEYDQGEPRFVVTGDGKRLIDAFGISSKGKVLAEGIGSARWEAMRPIYHACVARGLPSYSVCQVKDVRGLPVDYERLLLPFGNDQTVTQLVASFKTISLDGGFQQGGLMPSGMEPPLYTVHAIIDRDFTPVRDFHGDDVIEI